jgi:hypothetical protein
MVTELHLGHVERYLPRLQRAARIGERERRLGVDERPHEPRGRETIDTGARPRHPGASAVVLRAKLRPRRFCGGIVAAGPRGHAERLLDPLASGRAEIVTALDGAQPLSHPAQRPRRLGRPSLFLAPLTERTNRGGEGIVVLSGQPAELLDQFLVRMTVDGRRLQHADLTAGRHDLLPYPVEVFARLGGRRQDVQGVAQHHRPHLLQAAPDAHAQMGRTRRQLVDKDEPAPARVRHSLIVSRRVKRLLQSTGTGRGTRD